MQTAVLSNSGNLVNLHVLYFTASETDYWNCLLEMFFINYDVIDIRTDIKMKTP